MDKIDEFVNNLQEEIFEEARQSFGEKGFHRWRNPRFAGRMENAHAHGRFTGSCGDTMEIFFILENNRVQKASYMTNGCASSGISGSFAVELSIGKTLDELADITGEDVLEKIGRLPDEDKHCAFLAADTIHDAILDYRNKKKE